MKKRNSFFLFAFLCYKDLVVINVDNIIHHKSVRAKVLPSFKDQSIPIIFYTYTSSIAPRIFNNIRALQDLSSDNLKAKPNDCSFPIPYSNMVLLVKSLHEI